MHHELMGRVEFPRSVRMCRRRRIGLVIMLESSCNNIMLVRVMFPFLHALGCPTSCPNFQIRKAEDNLIQKEYNNISLLRNYYLNTCAKLVTRTTARRLSLLVVSECQFADLIHQCASLLHTTGNTAVARRDIKARVPCEEIPRA